MKRYLLTVAALTILFCLAVGLFNYRVDPYGLYHFEQADEEWLSRIDQFYHLRVTKPWYVRQLEPDAIVVGTSRTGTVDPNHAAWSVEEGYNFAVPGMKMYEILRFIEHANSVRPLSRLTIGLDFEMLISTGYTTGPGFVESRLARTSADLDSVDTRLQWASEVRDTLFSMSGLKRSIAAVTGTANVGRVYAKSGTWESVTSRFTGARGVVFIGRNNVLPYGEEHFQLDQDMQYFADILRYAHEHDIDTRLFITPVHVFFIDLWWRRGMQDLWREFHARLVAVNDEVALEMGRKPFPLLAFNKLEGVVDEPIRGARDSAGAAFSDGVHFRPRLGDVVMEAAWGEDRTSAVFLEAGNVDSYVDQVSRLRERFESENATQTAELRQKISPSLP